MPARSSALEVAVLGLLGEQPLHGYELRTRLDLLFGALRRRISFGSLYPALRDLEERGLIAPVVEAPEDAEPAKTTASRPAPRRRRVVYALTGPGEQHLACLLATSGPATWEDGDFDVRFAFFARTEATTRLEVLEGRRTRVRERLERACSHADARPEARPGARTGGYLAELARHSTEQLERELAWLDQVVERERTVGPDPPPRTGPPEPGPPGTLRPVMPRAPRRAP